MADAFLNYCRPDREIAAKDCRRAALSRDHGLVGRLTSGRETPAGRPSSRRC